MRWRSVKASPNPKMHDARELLPFTAISKVQKEFNEWQFVALWSSPAISIASDNSPSGTAYWWFQRIGKVFRTEIGNHWWRLHQRYWTFWL